MNIGSCVDPNPLRVERQNPDNFPRLQTRERCALEIAAYVFKLTVVLSYFEWPFYTGFTVLRFLWNIVGTDPLAKHLDPSEIS